MSKILALVSIACLVALTTAAVLLMMEVRGLVRDVRSDVAGVDKNTAVTLATIAAAAEQAREASAQANLAAQEQRAYWNKTSLETYKTMASLRLTIVRTDRSVNDVVMPQLAKTMRDTDAMLVQTGADLHETAVALQPALVDLARASSAAADTMADPHIRETLAHVDETTAQTAEAVKQLAGMAANAKIASDLALERLRQAMKPQRLVVTLFEKMLGLAAEGAQVYYATH